MCVNCCILNSCVLIYRVLSRQAVKFNKETSKPGNLHSYVYQFLMMERSNRYIRNIQHRIGKRDDTVKTEKEATDIRMFSSLDQFYAYLSLSFCCQIWFFFLLLKSIFKVVENPRDKIKFFEHFFADLIKSFDLSEKMKSSSVFHLNWKLLK